MRHPIKINATPNKIHVLLPSKGFTDNEATLPATFPAMKDT
jgi:hypothetical protein